MKGAIEQKKKKEGFGFAAAGEDRHETEHAASHGDEREFFLAGCTSKALRREKDGEKGTQSHAKCVD